MRALDWVLVGLFLILPELLRIHFLKEKKHFCVYLSTSLMFYILYHTWIDFMCT